MTEGGGEEELELQGIVDIQIIKLVPEEAQIMTSFIANEALFWLVTDVLGIVAGVSLKWDPTSITLAQIKTKLDNLQKDMNVLLEADLKTAFYWLESASKALKNESYESAYSKLEKVLEYSVNAYSKLENSTFGKKVFCMKMIIFAKRMTQCYDKDTRNFDNLHSLPINKQKELAEDVISDVDKILEEFEKIQASPNWWQRKVKKTKSKRDEQHVVDGLLKAALPIIWHHYEPFKGNGWKDKKVLRYVPGINVEILLEGKWPINVFKVFNSEIRWEFHEKRFVDESIRKTTFFSISSNSFCKYISSLKTDQTV